MRICSLIFLIGLITAGSAQAQQSPGDSAATYRTLLDRYCVSCHNETLKTANLLLDQANIADISRNPQLWERVLMKLSLRAMPPVGMPLRPTEDEYRDLTAYLISELDSHAKQNPNPGFVTLHRLNRTEYANAIRDLLAVEIDTDALLPPDNIGQGFDNIAEVLAVSPLLMEQYMFAAGRISRLAVGPSSMLPASETFHISNDFQQHARMDEDLPFGTRGGMVVEHYFPMDGEYTLSVTLHRNAEGYIRGIREEHQLDFRLDNAPLGRLSVGGKRLGRPSPLFTGSQNPHYAGDDNQTGYDFTADEALKIRFNAKAGLHKVGVSFIEDRTRATGILTGKMLLPDMGPYKGGKPALASVTITGPFEAAGPGNTASREKIFTCQPSSGDESDACARSILSRLARLAYRRPVTQRDMNELMALYDQGRQQDGFAGGVNLALQGILTGPEFLFRIEQDPEDAVPGSIYPVGDIELASRLSFFLWSSIPNDELLEVAEQGRLREPAVLRAQIRRMMADDRAGALIENFAGQWLQVRNVDIAEPHPNNFPEFDDELRVALKEETRLWFRDLLREDRSVLELLDSDFTYLNERLAHHYGIEGVRGSRFRRVELDGHAERHGLLGKGSMLIATSYNNRTSPVLRGKWVLENLLNMPPPPPPEDVPALDVKGEDGRTLTLKQAMEQHRANPVCSACHKLMDPIGFALENYDAVGRYRTRYDDANAPVDSSGTLFDGREFSDTAGFRKGLLLHSDRIVHTVTEKLLTYALGRTLEHYDQPQVREIVRGMAAQDFTWSALVAGIAESMPFQYRRAR